MTPPESAVLRRAPLPDAGFGALVQVAGAADGRAMVEALEAAPDTLPDALYDAHGLLLLSGMQSITEDPELLLRLSRLFGPEVENYLETLTASRNVQHRK